MLTSKASTSFKQER